MYRIGQLFSLLIMLSCAIIARADDTVEFQPIVTDDPVSTMSMTPDGAYLLMAQQASDSVSVWDVKQEKIVKTFTTPSPSSIFCPGNEVFVANRGKGTISVFSIKNDWKLQDQLNVDKPNVIHLSGPIGNNFKNQLLAVCANDDRQAYSAYVHLIDTAHDKCQQISTASLATVSNDGKTVITQGSFNLSPSGGISVYAWADFIGNKKPKALTSAGDSITFAYPSAKSAYWITCASIFGGSPISRLKENLGNLIIPDLQLPVVYSLNDNLIIAHKLDTQFTEIGKRNTNLKKPLVEDINKVAIYLFRHRQGIYDRPYACVNGNDLHLFVMNLEKGIVLRAKTTAFITGAPTTAPSSVDSTASNLGIPARVIAGSPLEVTLPAEKSPITYELVNGPDGMKIESGKLKWSPTEKDAGQHQLKIRVVQGDSIVFVRHSVEVISDKITRGGPKDVPDAHPDKKEKPDKPADKPAFKLKDIHALTMRNGNAMNPQAISRKYDNAVVMIVSDQASGSGFAVGITGYILTCAHVIENPDNIKVVYKTSDSETKSTFSDAKLVAWDVKMDIALLKIDPPKPLVVVAMAGKDPTESGEQVTVIGNPGAGDTVLTHTMTTGIISNPDRSIDGYKHIQTSAAINPGCSGGPMFDSHGQVIGLVSLKANIEGAGFALSIKSIRDFLTKAGSP